MRHHVVGKIRPLMGSKGGIFFFPAACIKQTNKKPQIICCGACLEHRAGLAVPECSWLLPADTDTETCVLGWGVELTPALL